MKLSVDQNEYRLFPDPGSESEADTEGFVASIVRKIGPESEKRPLQCVTFKQPLPEYLRLKTVCKRWRLRYSDILRLFLVAAIEALEKPSGELRELLQVHRDQEVEKDLKRIE